MDNNTAITICKNCGAWLMYDKDIDEADIPKLCIGCQKIEDDKSI